MLGHHHLQCTLSQLQLHPQCSPHRTSHHLQPPQTQRPQNHHLQCTLSQPQSHHSASHHRTSHQSPQSLSPQSLSPQSQTQSPQSQRSMTSHQYWSQRSMTSHQYWPQRSLPYHHCFHSHHCFHLRPLQKQMQHQRMQSQLRAFSESGQFPYNLSYTASNSEAKQLQLQ